MQTKYAMIISLGLLTTAGAVSSPAGAVTLPGSAGLAAAADSASITEHAAYVMPSLAASSPLAPALLVDGPELLLLPRLVRLGLGP